MKFATRTLAVTAIAGMAALSTAAWADSNDTKALAEAKVSLTDAIKAAEEHVGGNAYDASIDDDSFGAPAFEVEVAKDGKTFDVRVDGKTGEVLDSREDHDD